VRRDTQTAVFWIAGFLLLGVAIYAFRSILFPFVAGMALAYALDPIANWLERLGLRRGLASLLILIVIFATLAFVLLLLVPLLLTQLLDFLKNLPSYVEKLQSVLAPLLDTPIARYLHIDYAGLRASLTEFLTSGAALVTTLLGTVLSGGRALIDIASLFVVTPFVVFYLLRDWHLILVWIDDLVPRDHLADVRTLATEIDARVAAFVRGQMLSGLILGLVYAAGLMLVGLDYGLLIGLAAGILSFIPYLGFAAGFVAAIVVALVQFTPDWFRIAAVVVVFIIGQNIEGYVLQPYLIGPRVGLHPVWLIFALLAFGALFGFVGLFIAIPGAAAIGVLLHFAVQRYQASALYQGVEGSADNDR
jgi:predicted PurR-regulated permease PerM